MNRIRAFFAVMLPSEIQDVLSHAIAQIKESPNKIFPEENIRWIRQESWHITLQFMAGLARDDLKDLIRAILLEESSISAFTLELGQLEWFPANQYPKILALSLSQKSQQTLLQLSQALGQRLAALGYPLESRPYRAHLSLGRVIHPNKTESPLADMQLQKIPSFKVDSYYLLESRPDKGQHHYCPLAKFGLS